MNSEPQLNLLIQLRKILAEKRNQYDIEQNALFGHHKACQLADEIYQLERLIRSLHKPPQLVTAHPLIPRPVTVISE